MNFPLQILVMFTTWPYPSQMKSLSLQSFLGNPQASKPMAFNPQTPIQLPYFSIWGLTPGPHPIYSPHSSCCDLFSWFFLCCFLPTQIMSCVKECSFSSLIIIALLHISIKVYQRISCCRTFLLSTCKGSATAEKCLIFGHSAYYRQILPCTKWLWETENKSMWFIIFSTVKG